MKRLVCIVLTVMTLLGILAACGTSKRCDVCDKEYSGKSYTINVLGEKFKVCKDCKNEVSELF